MVEGGRSGTKAAMEVRKPDDSQRRPNKISRESAAKPEKDFGETFLFHFSACRSLFEQIALLRKRVCLHLQRCCMIEPFASVLLEVHHLFESSTSPSPSLRCEIKLAVFQRHDRSRYWSDQFIIEDSRKQPLPFSTMQTLFFITISPSIKP